MRVDRRQGQIGDAFVAEDLRQMRLAPRYNEWLFSLVRPHLGRRIFEVGSGIGNVTLRLLETAEHVFGIEPNADCVEELRRAVGADPRFEFRPWRVEECDRELLRGRRFDSVLCINVLEHIEDDVGALGFFRSVLGDSGGTVVVLVPAVASAYGDIDAALGHFRRYSRASLTEAFRRAGLEVASVRYSNLVGLLGWLYNARIRRIVKQQDSQIRIFDRLIVPWASRLERTMPPPVGLSLIAVGRARPADRPPQTPAH